MLHVIKRCVVIFAAVASYAIANAVPPMPGYIKVAQPDGTTIEARIEGNSDFHYYVTPEGNCLVGDLTDGFIKPATIDSEGMIVPMETAGVHSRGISAEFTAEDFRAAALRTREAIIAKREARRAPARIAPGAIKRDFPTTGTVRGLIVLAEFQDVKFQEGSTQEYFDTKVNTYGYSGPETYGSVVDYFKEQSGGVFTPEFDVVGPVTLPRKRADYGLDEDVDGFFREAAIAARDQAKVDFSRYDINEDYFVDFFFVIFAGHGEAQGGPAECIWPVMKDESDYIFDAFNGLYLGVSACSCELKHGEGTDLDGVGTICHEFSHILGLPDIYDSTYSGGYGMGHFDMMDRGPYNNDLSTPSGYTAMDKYTLGWLEPRILEEPEKDVTLRSFVSSNDCCFIVNPDNPNEYYTLENRQLEGFDSALPGHGLVISYVNYDRSLWKKNVINSPGMARYEHVTIVPADGMKELELENTRPLEAGDPWPGSTGKTEFTNTSIPAALWRSSGTSTPVNMPITNIRESEDGVITFDFNIAASVNDIIASPSEKKTYFNLQGMEVPGEQLAPGIYIVRTQDGKTTKISVR